MGNWAYLHRLEEGMGAGGAAGPWTQSPSSSSSSDSGDGEKKKSCESIHVLRHKNFPRKKKEDEKKTPNWVGGGGKGEKSKVCPPDVGL